MAKNVTVEMICHMKKKKMKYNATWDVQVFHLTSRQLMEDGYILYHCILGNSGIACGGSWRLNLYERKLQPGEIFESPLRSQ